MNTIAQLILTAVRTDPGAVFGTFQQYDRLERVSERAHEVAARLRSAGLMRGDIVALVGNNCAAYLVIWMAAQLVGIQTALINPTYPDEFLSSMLDDLMPTAIIWIARAPGGLAERGIRQLDAARAWEGEVIQLGSEVCREKTPRSAGPLASGHIAAYIHTSGTTGKPKFCALSQGYFMRLGRYFADVMSLTHHDVVVNPLPLFHINPMGNGVVGALTAKSGFLSTEKFSVTEFWPLVKQHGATVLVLHGPPSSMLKAKTTFEDARGHHVRIGFYCDPAFLEQFDIPIGVGGYGSTEAGGYCHSWKFRPGDRELPPEGAMHLSGQPRYDIDCTLSEEGEIWVRGKTAETLFSGYAKSGNIDPHLDEDGWFHTGDRGRFDHCGNLIFIERRSDSIRVNAEYVPIDLVEERLKRVASLGDFALWRIDSLTRGHEVVVFTTSREVSVEDLRHAVADLPKYMHPIQVICIEAIPRDAGVGKIQRRLLGQQTVVAVLPI